MSIIDVKILDAISESELDNLGKEVYARLNDIKKKNSVERDIKNKLNK